MKALISLKYILLLSGLILWTTTLVAKKPDVLFIAIDDMNDWTTLFDEGNPIQTPNLKRLAERGTFFTRAYCASPGCNPSRVALLTGYRPTTSGVYGNPDRWREIMPDALTLPKYFEVHGDYLTRGAGKIFHHGRWGGDFTDNPSFQEFFDMLPIRAPGEGNKHNGFNEADGFYSMRRPSLDWGEHGQKMIDVDTVEFIEAKMDEARTKPAFFAAGIFSPHLPFYAPSDTFTRYPLDQTVMPPMPEGDLDDKGEMAMRMVRKEHYIFDNTTAQEPYSPGSLEKMVQSYQAAADFADEMVGRLLDKLDETGRAENTIIVLWADHGYHLGDKETCVKFTLWEKANHVPFIVVAPGITTPGSRCDQPVSLMDIYPTLLELAGLPPKADNDGLSLVPLLKHPNSKWVRPALMTEGPGNHAIRSERWRYIRYNDGTEELYDQDKDPWNHENLAGYPQYESVMVEHRKWLPKNEAPGKAMQHLLESPPAPGAGVPKGLWPPKR